MTTLDDLFSSRHATVIHDAVAHELRDAARARLAGAGYTRYRLLDRGCYDHHADPDEPGLLATIVELASTATGRALEVRSARALRLEAGGYVLAHHDPLHADNPVEAILDLSAEVVPGATIHYRRRGQVYFQVESAPGSLAIVERGPTVSCNHSYLSRRSPDASVVRLIALLGTSST